MRHTPNQKRVLSSNSTKGSQAGTPRACVWEEAEPQSRTRAEADLRRFPQVSASKQPFICKETGAPSLSLADLGQVRPPVADTTSQIVRTKLTVSHRGAKHQIWNCNRLRGGGEQVNSHTSKPRLCSAPGLTPLGLSFPI